MLECTQYLLNPILSRLITEIVGPILGVIHILSRHPHEALRLWICLIASGKRVYDGSSNSAVAYGVLGNLKVIDHVCRLAVSRKIVLRIVIRQKGVMATPVVVSATNKTVCAVAALLHDRLHRAAAIVGVDRDGIAIWAGNLQQSWNASSKIFGVGKGMALHVHQ